MNPRKQHTDVLLHAGAAKGLPRQTRVINGDVAIGELPPQMRLIDRYATDLPRARGKENVRLAKWGLIWLTARNVNRHVRLAKWGLIL